MPKIQRKQIGNIPHSSLSGIVGGVVHLTVEEYTALLALINAPEPETYIYDGGRAYTPSYSLILSGGTAFSVSSDTIVDCGDANTQIT